MCRGRFSLRWGLQKTLELWFAKWVAKGIHRRRLCIADDIWQSRLSPHHVRSDAEYLHPNAQLRPAFFLLYIRLASVCSPLFARTRHSQIPANLLWLSHSSGCVRLSLTLIYWILESVNAFDTQVLFPTKKTEISSVDHNISQKPLTSRSEYVAMASFCTCSSAPKDYPSLPSSDHRSSDEFVSGTDCPIIVLVYRAGTIPRLACLDNDSTPAGTILDSVIEKRCPGWGRAAKTLLVVSQGCSYPKCGS